MVVFEPNGMKSGRLFHEALQISHVIKYSQERIGPLRDLDKCEGRKLEIETLGDEGLRFRLLGVPGKPARWKELGAYPISVLKDAAGAGDWCTAGVVHSLGKMGASGFNQAAPNAIEHALNVGQGLAALKCGYEGPRGMMYSVKTDQLEANLEQLIERRPLSNIADAIEAHAIPEAIKGICPSCPSLGKSETASKKAVARR
jgi:fructokinase